MDDILLTKYLLKEANEAEAAAVRKWIMAHPDHEKRLVQLQLVWDASQKLASNSEVDEQEAWQRFVQRREKKGNSSNGRTKVMLYQVKWLRMVAMLVLLPIAGLMGYYFLTSSEGRLFGTMAYEATDAIRTDTLRDGSIVTLNKFAALQFSQKPFQRKRLVELREGEAFFRVATNRKKPFVIRSGDVTVTVLGTSFHVKRHTNEETEVIVESGRVKVEGLNRTVELKPGQRVTINTRTQQFDEEEVKDQLHNYYISNSFVLDKTPLWRVVEVLEAAYDVEIEIARDEIRNLPMTTTFPRGELTGILHIISETLGVTVEQQGNSIILK